MGRCLSCLILFVLLLICSVCAAVEIGVNNPGFEDPPGGKQVGVVPTGWSIQGTDFGIEGVSCEAAQSLFLGKNNSGYQLTDHTIAAGDKCTLRFDAFKTWPASPTATYKGRLYYEQGANRIVIASVAGSDVAMDCDEYQLSYTVQPSDSFIGKKLGVLFINTSTYGAGIWVGFDDVHLDVTNLYSARWPVPADGAENVDPKVVLGWTPGDAAASHDVYFGTDFNSVSDANNFLPVGTTVYKGNQAVEANSYDPCNLEFMTAYYWRIDEVNGVDIWKGNVWRFTTRLGADFNCDGIVDYKDLAIMAGDWLNSGLDVVADADGDNKVDLKDYTVAANSWYWGCYYIDSVNGSNDNDGKSPGTAWQSLGPVNGRIFRPGDMILFKGGTTYTGQLKPQGSGTADKPIIIDMYGDGNKPRIDGEGNVLDTLLLANVQYWEVSNLEITNLGPTRAEWRTGVRISADGCGTLHHIHLKNLYVHDVNGSLDKSTEGCGIFWECKGAVPSRFDGLLIENCHVVRTDRNGICGRSSFTDRSANWFPSLNVVIRGNLIEDCGGDCIKPWGCQGCLVEYNVVHGGRQRCSDYAAGIWPWSCDNTVIQFNEVSDIKGTRDGQGFDSDYNCRNSLFQYNYSHDNDGGFMLICGPAASSWSVGTVGTVIRYNISQNDAERTFHISGGGVQDTFIYNNVIYIGASLNIPITLFGEWEGWPDSTCFYNNIFYVEGTGKYAYATSRNDDGTYNYNLGFGSSTNNVFQNNVYYGNHTNPPADPNGITYDPNLINAGSGGNGMDTLDGYMLEAGSVCIQAGTNTGIGYNDPNYLNGGRDLWGNALPEVNAPDIGAHQFSN